MLRNEAIKEKIDIDTEGAYMIGNAIIVQTAIDITESKDTIDKYQSKSSEVELKNIQNDKYNEIYKMQDYDIKRDVYKYFINKILSAKNLSHIKAVHKEINEYVRAVDLLQSCMDFVYGDTFSMYTDIDRDSFIREIEKRRLMRGARKRGRRKTSFKVDYGVRSN